MGVGEYGGHCCSFEGGILPLSQWWTKPSIIFIDHFTKEAIKKIETSQTK
jgi:hypothetical protein